MDIDHTWQPVKDYIEKEIKPNEKEKVYFDSYEPAELEEIMDKQHKVIDYLKSQGSTKMFQILIVMRPKSTTGRLARCPAVLVCAVRGAQEEGK